MKLVIMEVVFIAFTATFGNDGGTLLLTADSLKSLVDQTTIELEKLLSVHTVFMMWLEPHKRTKETILLSPLTSLAII